MAQKDISNGCVMVPLSDSCLEVWGGLKNVSGRMGRKKREKREKRKEEKRGKRGKREKRGTGVKFVVDGSNLVDVGENC